MVFSHLSPLMIFFLPVALGMSFTSAYSTTMTPSAVAVPLQAPQQSQQPQGSAHQDLKQLLSSNDYMSKFLDSNYVKIARSLKIPENRLYDINTFDPLQKIFIHKFFSEDPFFIALIRFSYTLTDSQFQDLVSQGFLLHQADLGLEKTKQTIEAVYQLLKASQSLPTVSLNNTQAAETLNNFIYTIIYHFIAQKNEDTANYLWGIYQKLTRKEPLTQSEQEYYAHVKESFDELNAILSFFNELLTQNKLSSALLNEEFIVELTSIVNALLDFCRNKEDVLYFKGLFSAYLSMIKAGIVKG